MRKDDDNPDDADLRRRISLLSATVEPLVLTSAPLQRTYEQLRLVVYLKVPGCWLAAPHGRGKTVAIEYCARRLKAEIPGLPVFIVNEQILPGNELRSFFIRALTESEYDKPISNDATILRQRLPMHWAELSKKSPLHCVILFLDEGQSMRDADDGLLRDLSNQMVRLGGSLMTISLGESPAFEAMISKRKDANHMNGAVDRLFGGRQLDLGSYESESDWASLFAEMDSTAFEVLGGRTITQVYFSHLNMQDFRLENEARRFCKALRKVYGPKALKDVNLRRVFVGIRHALLTTALNSISNHLTTITEISEKTWLAALDYSMHA